jgi:hypothetical protein
VLTFCSDVSLVTGLDDFESIGLLFEGFALPQAEEFVETQPLLPDRFYENNRVL